MREMMAMATARHLAAGRWHGVVASAVLALGSTAALRGEEWAGVLRVDQPPAAQRSDAVVHRVDFRAVVTAPYGTRLLRVWLPLPPDDAGQEILDSELETFPQDVQPQIHTEPLYGNRFAYFEFPQPQGAQIIQHRFTARVWEQRWHLDPQRVPRVDHWPEAFQPYLRQVGLQSRDGLQELLRQVVPQRGNPAHDLRRVMEWIDNNLVYDHSRASLRADADHALRHRRGHCSDYHGLCATMARELGYPSRVAYGLSLVPKNSPSHCKLEAFLPPYGWVSFDLSETQKLVRAIENSSELAAEEKRALAEAARRRLAAGFRENSWLLLTRGTHYELAPPASQRVSVVRTLYAEADGQPLPDPDPANPQQREFAWMTAHHYEADREFQRPFADLSTLDAWRSERSQAEGSR